MNRWSQKSFDQILILIKAAIFDGERLSKSYSEAKIYMRKLRLDYISIHACKNDCILFYKENKQASEYSKCGEFRYKIDNKKGNKISHKVLRYFSLIPRLQRLYMSIKIVEEIRWHMNSKIWRRTYLAIQLTL